MHVDIDVIARLLELGVKNDVKYLPLQAIDHLETPHRALWRVGVSARRERSEVRPFSYSRLSNWTTEFAHPHPPSNQTHCEELWPRLGSDDSRQKH